MSVAAIPARDWALTAEPSIGAVAVGIAFHQWADFFLGVVFFGVLGKWTAHLSPVLLAVAAVPWAVLTSALEWFVLVPFFPFWQAIFTLQQPYWIGFLVHLSSSFPLFAWLRRSALNANHSGAEHFSVFGALELFVESCCLGPPRCSPHTIANCHGAGETR